MIWLEPYEPPSHIVDGSNLRGISVAFFAYEEDNDGAFPRHIKDLIDQGYITVRDRDSLLLSRYDEARTLPIVDSDNVPDDWYQYGSYFYYPTADLKIDRVTEPSRFVLMYSAPYDNSEKYAAAFLDYHVQSLSKEELFKIIEEQGSLIMPGLVDKPSADY